MKKKNEEKKSINDLIIDEAVKQFKEGKIKNSLDVESYLDSLLQPLMQKLLDADATEEEMLAIATAINLYIRGGFEENKLTIKHNSSSSWNSKLFGINQLQK